MRSPQALISVSFHKLLKTVQLSVSYERWPGSVPPGVWVGIGVKRAIKQDKVVLNFITQGGSLF